MILPDDTEIRGELTLLVGKQLSLVRNLSFMKAFGFGAIREVDAEHVVSEWALHVTCPWRIEDDRRVVTGSLDRFARATDNSDPTWDPNQPKGSLQDQRMAALLHGPFSLLRTHNNTLGELFVEDVVLLPFNGLMVRLSPRYRLVVFPCGSQEEEWRFFRPGTDADHLVLEAGTIHRE